MVRFWKVLVPKREGSDLMSKGHLLTLKSIVVRALLWRGMGFIVQGSAR